MQFLTQSQYASTVVWMQMLSPECQGIKASFPSGGNTAQMTHSVVDIAGVFSKVKLVIRKSSQLGARREAGLALLPALIVALADKRVGENMRGKLQALDQRVRPVALCAQGIEAQCSD